MYYFDTDDGDEKFRDEIGLELDDDQEARDEASRALAALAKEYVPGPVAQKNVTMRVRDERGEPLLQLSLSFAIQPLKEPLPPTAR
jgi:hypothetical protein